MKNSVFVVVFCSLVLTWLAHASPLPAQPILERLEQEIRSQIGQTDAPAKSTDEPAAEGSRRVVAETAGERASVKPGYLGVVADDAKDRGRGVRILDVRPGGPADRAGLRKQDLITAVAGVRVQRMDEMADILILIPAGDAVVFDILRGAKRQQVKVTLGRRPPPGQPATRPESVPPPATKPSPVGPELQDPKVATPPAEAPSEIEQLRRRVEQLERRVAELERALAEALKKQ